MGTAAGCVETISIASDDDEPVEQPPKKRKTPADCQTDNQELGLGSETGGMPQTGQAGKEPASESGGHGATLVTRNGQESWKKSRTAPYTLRMYIDGELAVEGESVHRMH